MNKLSEIFKDEEECAYQMSGDELIGLIPKDSKILNAKAIKGLDGAYLIYFPKKIKYISGSGLIREDLDKSSCESVIVGRFCNKTKCFKKGYKDFFNF